MTTSQIIVVSTGLGIALGLSFVFALHARARSSGKSLEDSSGWFSLLYYAALPRWANIAYNLVILAALVVGALPILNLLPGAAIVQVVALVAIAAVVTLTPQALVRRLSHRQGRK